MLRSVLELRFRVGTLADQWDRQTIVDRIVHQPAAVDAAHGQQDDIIPVAVTIQALAVQLNVSMTEASAIRFAIKHLEEQIRPGCQSCLDITPSQNA